MEEKDRKRKNGPRRLDVPRSRHLLIEQDPTVDCIADVRRNFATAKFPRNDKRREEQPAGWVGVDFLPLPHVCVCVCMHMCAKSTVHAMQHTAMCTIHDRVRGSEGGRGKGDRTNCRTLLVEGIIGAIIVANQANFYPSGAWLYFVSPSIASSNRLQ